MDLAVIDIYRRLMIMRPTKSASRLRASVPSVQSGVQSFGYSPAIWRRDPCLFTIPEGDQDHDCTRKVLIMPTQLQVVIRSAFTLTTRINLSSVRGQYAPIMVPEYPQLEGTIRSIMCGYSCSPFSPFHLSLLHGPGSSPLKLQLKAQGHEMFPIGIVLCLITICAALHIASSYRRLLPGPRDHLIIGNPLE